MTTTLVLGAARSGKSAHAQSLLADRPAITYVATGPEPDPDQDADWAQRVARHRADRPEGWTTVETQDLTRALMRARSPVLVDCLGTWLTRSVDQVGGWEDPDRAREHVADLVDHLVVAWRHLPVDAVAVSNEVGWGVVPETPAGRLFRDLVGAVNARIAAASDRVHLVVAGRVLQLDDTPVVPAAGRW